MIEDTIPHWKDVDWRNLKRYPKMVKADESVEYFRERDFDKSVNGFFLVRIGKESKINDCSDHAFTNSWDIDGVAFLKSTLYRAVYKKSKNDPKLLVLRGQKNV